MATDSIDKELLENGVKDTITADIEQEYNSSFNEMSADSSKANIARCLRLLYTSFKTASGNDKILRKMYKDLKKKYLYYHYLSYHYYYHYILFCFLYYDY